MSLQECLINALNNINSTLHNFASHFTSELQVLITDLGAINPFFEEAQSWNILSDTKDIKSISTVLTKMPKLYNLLQN